MRLFKKGIQSFQSTSTQAIWAQINQSNRLRTQICVKGGNTGLYHGHWQEIFVADRR